MLTVVGDADGGGGGGGGGNGNGGSNAIDAGAASAFAVGKATSIVAQREHTSAPDGDQAALRRLGQALKDAGHRFTTVTPATHARVNARAGNAWARNLQDVFGWSRPFHADTVPTSLMALMQDAGVVLPHADGWRATVRASTLHGELFLHSAHPTTSSDAVFFGPDTYRFAAALDHHLATGASVHRAVDIGSGAGPGAVVTALARPDAEVVAVDINPTALAFTAVNAGLAGAGHVRVQRSDLLSAVDGRFDLIVANPPYLLDRDERVYRHGGGTLGEGLSLAIAGLAESRLAPGGTLLLYTGAVVAGGVDGFRERVTALLTAAGLAVDYREVDPDVFGEGLDEPAYAEADRIAAVVVTATKPVR